MSRSPLRLAARVVALLSTVAALACTGQATGDSTPVVGERFVDLGSPQDGSPQADVYLAPDWSYWGGGGDWKNFIRYENGEDFRWATTPPNPENYVVARVLKSNYAGQLRVRAFDRRPGKAHLAIRYKDNLVAPASLWIQQREQLVSLGALGGARDHAWKTTVVAVDGAKLEPKDGRYVFQIGKADYGGVEGDLPLDWVKLSTQPIAAEPNKPGFYPPRAPSRFDQCGRTQVYREGGKPMFPVGVCILGLRAVTFEQAKRAGLNSLMILGWEMSYAPWRKVYAEGGYPDRLSAGLPDLLDLAKRSGVDLLPCPATDTRSYWIEHQYGTEQKALAAIEEGIGRNANAPGLLAWFIKDEADHDDATWGAPEEFLQQVYNAQKRRDPSKPALVNFQGWKSGQYLRYQDAADIVAFDSYPIGRGESGRAIADYADRVRREAQGKKAMWAIVEAFDAEHFAKIQRQMTDAETLVQAYIAIAHGMQGVFFFIGNGGKYIDPEELKGPWKGLSQAAREILDDKEGVKSYLLPPARPVHLAEGGKPGLASVEDIHAAIFEGPDKSQLMIAADDSAAPHAGVTLKWPGLQAGRQVEVRFESRSLTSTPGAIKDDFAGFGRHVYVLK